MRIAVRSTSEETERSEPAEQGIGHESMSCCIPVSIDLVIELRTLGLGRNDKSRDAVAVKDGLHAPEAFAVQFHQDGEHRVALMAADRQRLRDQAVGEPLG